MGVGIGESGLFQSPFENFILTVLRRRKNFGRSLTIIEQRGKGLSKSTRVSSGRGIGRKGRERRDLRENNRSALVGGDSWVPPGL